MRILILLVFYLTVLFLSGCENSSEPSVELYDIKYEVTGTAEMVSITIENQDGGTSQFSETPIPWSHSFERKKKKGTFLYLSAQNMGNEGGIVVTIYANGNVFKSSASSGGYVIATASGSL